MFPFGILHEIRSISPYSVRMRENADQNNSEYGHFLRSVWDDKHDNAYEKVDKRLEYFSSEWVKVVMIIDEVDIYLFKVAIETVD